MMYLSNSVVIQRRLNFAIYRSNLLALMPKLSCFIIMHNVSLVDRKEGSEKSWLLETAPLILNSNRNSFYFLQVGGFLVFCVLVELTLLLLLICSTVLYFRSELKYRWVAALNTVLIHGTTALFPCSSLTSVLE